MDPTPDLDELNDSELLQLAQAVDIRAHRGLPRDVLKRLITLDLINTPDLPQRPVDKKRLRIMSWVDAHWKQVEPLVQSCPARTRDLRACFQCTDIQVMECALNNPIVFQGTGEDMALPEKYKGVTRTREEWLEIAKDTDPQKRKEISGILRDLGHQPADYMSWDPEKRAEIIFAKQEEGKGGGETKASTSGSTGTKGAASSGGSASNAEVLAALAKNEALLIKIHNLLVVQIFTDPKAKANAEEMDIKVDLIGGNG